MIRAEDGLVHDWDRGDAAEWAPVEIRVSRLAIAFALIIVGAVVGILWSVPGAANGATLLAVIMVVGAIVMTVRELHRGGHRG